MKWPSLDESVSLHVFVYWSLHAIVKYSIFLSFFKKIGYSLWKKIIKISGSGRVRALHLTVPLGFGSGRVRWLHASDNVLVFAGSRDISIGFFKDGLLNSLAFFVAVLNVRLERTEFWGARTAQRSRSVSLFGVQHLSSSSRAPQWLSRSSSSLLHWSGWLQWQQHGCESQQEQTGPLNSLPGRYQRDVGNRLVRKIKPDLNKLLYFSMVLLCCIENN